MKKALLLSFVLPVAQPGQAQLIGPPENREVVVEETTFATAGQQEDYWARRLFQQHYAYQEYARFTGRPVVTGTANNLRLRFGQDTLLVSNCDSTLSQIFRAGLLYPGVSGEAWLQHVSNVTELRRATNSGQRRRFTCRTWNGFTLNPTVYVFELRNPKATEATDMRTFIQGARVTFIKEGWGVI